MISCPSESDGNHSTEDEASPMDDVPDKADRAGGLTAPIISLSTGAGGQLILNDSGSLLAGAQSLLLNGNSLISNAGSGVIINGLSLADCQTVTLSPVAAGSPVILNGAQVIPKAALSVQPRAASVPEGDGVSLEDTSGRLPTVVLSTSSAPASSASSIISTALRNKAEGHVEVDFIHVPDSESRTISSSSPSLSPPSPALASPLALPRSLSTASVVMSTSSVSLPSQPVEYVVLSTSGSQLSPCSSVVTSATALPQVFSLPQVVPSIQGVPVSQPLQQSPGAQVSQCPQLVPVAPLTSSAPQFQSQALNISKKPIQQPQQNASSSLPSGPTTIVSVSQLSSLQLPQQGDQTTTSARSKIQLPQVISISPPTQVVPAPPPKAGTPQLVPVSMPQLVPVSSVQTSSNISFPQVVPASPSLSIPSSGVPLQILTSAPQAPLKINQLRPVQNSGPPAGVAPGVQLLNSGIIQLPSTPPGNLLLSGSPYLSVQQGKLILTIPAGIQLTSLPLKTTPEPQPVSNGASLALAPTAPVVTSCPTPAGLASPPLNFISQSPPYGAPENATGAVASPHHALDHSAGPATPSALTPESMLTLSPMYSGVTSSTQSPQPAWSPVPLSASAGLALFDVRGKVDLPVDPGLLGLPGGESLLLGSPSPEQDAGSALDNPEDMDGDAKILTQLQSVPVDDELGL